MLHYETLKIGKSLVFPNNATISGLPRVSTDQFPSNIILLQPEELQNLLKSGKEFSELLFLNVFTSISYLKDISI